jgi:hypothetical protein
MGETMKNEMLQIVEQSADTVQSFLQALNPFIKAKVAAVHTRADACFNVDLRQLAVDAASQVTTRYIL